MSDGGDDSEHVRIRVGDGTRLAGRLWRPAEGTLGDALVLLAPAMGVRQDLYGPLARHFASRDMAALTFDYRGIGASLGGRPVGEVGGDLLTWARTDLYGLLDWARERTGEREVPLAYLGHSMGVSLLGIADHPGGPDAVIAVAAPHAHWRMWDGWERLRMWFYWYVLFPAATSLAGYFPGRALGFGADLPSAVALKWARWARHPDYLVESDGRPIRAGFDRLSVPFLAVCSREDPYAPPAAVERLSGFFTAARRERWILSGSDVGISTLGHVDFFRDPPGAVLWDRWIGWLRSVLQTGGAVAEG